MQIVHPILSQINSSPADFGWRRINGNRKLRQESCQRWTGNSVPAVIVMLCKHHHFDFRISMQVKGTVTPVSVMGILYQSPFRSRPAEPLCKSIAHFLPGKSSFAMFVIINNTNAVGPKKWQKIMQNHQSNCDWTCNNAPKRLHSCLVYLFKPSPLSAQSSHCVFHSTFQLESFQLFLFDDMPSWIVGYGIVRFPNWF